MGLSRTDAPSITTIQAALELVGALKAIGDRKDFSQLLEDAYKIPEQEQAKADKARADIETNRQVLADNLKVLDQISAAQSTLDAKTQVLVNATAKLESAQDDLRDKEVEAQVRDASLRGFANELNARETAIAQSEASLAARIAKSVQYEKDLTVFDASLKARADQFKTLTEGL